MAGHLYPSRIPVRTLLVVGGLLRLATGCGGAANGESSADGRDSAARRSTAEAPGQTPLPSRGKAWVVFASDTVLAEVARSEEERSRGLMFREDVPPGTGMLFVFEEVRSRSFWMKNTYVPLSIAFMDEKERVVDIQDMEPEDESFTRSKAPALFALEVPQGWFEEHGVKVGDQAEIVFGPG